MRTFILLYKGPTTPPEASHAGWPGWFKKIGDALVDLGSPMTGGRSVRRDGSYNKTEGLNGYSIIRAGTADEARNLVMDHPYLAAGDQHTIEIFEVPKKAE